MSEELPKGWIKTTLGEIAKPSRERALPGEVPDVRYVGLEHIEPHKMRLLGHGYARNIRSSSVRFSKGDILYGKMRPYLNKIWVAEFDGLCSAEFLVFPQNEGINSQFLAMRMNADDFVTYSNSQVSGERPRVDFEKISGFPILLPPIPEQERIITSLSAALLRLGQAQTAARRACERIQRYRTVVLHSAVTGELTREWRKTQQDNKKLKQDTGRTLLQRLLAARRTRWEEFELQRLSIAGKRPKDDTWKDRYPEPTEPDTAGLTGVPNGWVWASADQLSDATRPITYGVIKLGPEVKDGVPILRSSDVRPLRLDLDHVKQIAKGIADEYQRTYLKGGEVLVTVRGTLGGVAKVPPECAGYNVSREVAMLALIDTEMSHAIAYFIGTDLLQQWLSNRTRGIAYTGINIETLRSLPIPVMPLTEQAQIVGEVDRRLAAADRLVATLEQQLSQALVTRQAMLYEAFTGMLVPQDPKDEPASVLLGRIRAKCKTEVQKRRTKGMQKNKVRSEVVRRPLLDILREHNKPMTPEELFREAKFEPSQVDYFYRELASLRDKLQEQKPTPSEARSWPYHAHVFLQLKES